MRSRFRRKSLCGSHSSKLAFSETSEIVDEYDDVIGDIVIERNKGRSLSTGSSCG
ncbi:hypothetical protein M405DRAFT_813907, partial [Rhizopogon salebrosus TDB-379]